MCKMLCFNLLLLMIVAGSFKDMDSKPDQVSTQRPRVGKQMWSHVQYAWKHGRALGGIWYLFLHLLNPKPICRYFQ
jgi:hypothetical protein